MVIHEKTISLKDGRTCLLRTPQEKDAPLLLNYLQTMSAETIYVLSYPDDTFPSLNEEISFIKSIRASFNRCMVSAFVDGELAGTAQIRRHTKIKTRHRADFGIGLLQKFCGLGLGGKILDELISMAIDLGCEVLELEVIQGNHQAIALYEKKGFVRFAQREKGIRLKDGTYLSEVLMRKDLIV